jgi:hypothetical protein
VSEIRDLLALTADVAADFLETLDERPVWPPAELAELRTTLGARRLDAYGAAVAGQVAAR